MLRCSVLKKIENVWQVSAVCFENQVPKKTLWDEWEPLPFRLLPVTSADFGPDGVLAHQASSASANIQTRQWSANLFCPSRFIQAEISSRRLAT